MRLAGGHPQEERHSCTSFDGGPQGLVREVTQNGPARNPGQEEKTDQETSVEAQHSAQDIAEEGRWSDQGDLLADLAQRQASNEGFTNNIG